MSVRCPDCDALIATQADFDAHADGCECDRCCALCWRAWCADVCQREPVDWRSRLSALEGLLRECKADAAIARMEMDAAVRFADGALGACIVFCQEECEHPDAVHRVEDRIAALRAQAELMRRPPPGMTLANAALTPDRKDQDGR